MRDARFTRRTALRAAGAGIAAGALGIGSAIADQGKTPAQGKTAVVIGSGFGGAVAAYRLGTAGIKTIVLERGRRWPITAAGDTFCSSAAPDRRAAWFSDSPVLSPLQQTTRIERYAGVLDAVRGNGLVTQYGAGVGGGSLVFGGFLAQPRRRDFEATFPRELDYTELADVYYARARKNLGGSPLPADILATPEYQGARSWLQDVADAGMEPHFFDFCIDWDVVRAELAGERVRSIAIAEMNNGTNSGAKNSVDRNYLLWAEQTGNVTVNPLHEVTEIRESGRQFTVSVRQIDEFGTTLGNTQVVADYLFMAAGSYYTPALLVSAKAKGHLRNLNQHVGQGYGTNGDFLFNRLNNRRPYGATHGGPGVALVYDDTHERGSISMAWQAVPPVGGIDLNSLTTHLIITDPQHRGSIDYNSALGRAELNYPWPEGNEADLRSQWMASRFKQFADDRHGFTANGVPVWPRQIGMGSYSSYHGLGGMVMGKACTTDGVVHGYDNLFVVDGSLLPGSAALVNPSLTVAAFAERCMDKFLTAPR
ncbi:GMC oxidoreductase [Nocardia sp. NPDC058658]|uniref:GMC oxidoreductase n=1 Tax=Nocardia sp. NPDC058658 TaxID=3346580 RepID=UPI00366659A6